MDPTTTASSTVTESCISFDAPPPSTPFQLEISLISAQDLASISKSMHTYVVTWIHPNRKHTSRTDQQGHKNPKWNDKFVFSLDKEIMSPENDANVTVEIYSASWLRDALVGTVQVRLSDLITPLLQNRMGVRFVALQVRRPSGSPQGILNMGVALLDSTVKTSPLANSPVKNFQEHKNHDNNANNIDLWRSMNADHKFHEKPESYCNGSMVDNGSELCSDIGPSASLVAAELAMKHLVIPSNVPKKLAHDEAETGSSIVEELTIEEAKAKGYRLASRERWRRASTAAVDGDESEILSSRKQRSKSSDGSLFSCFAYGIEFTIVCGGSKNNKTSSSKRKTAINAA